MRFLIHTLLEFLRDRNYRSLLGASVVILFGGALFYHLIEGWSYLDSVYFSAITLTTIGYGDFSPQTDAGKLFTIIYIGVGVGLILTFINTVFTHFTTVRRRYSTKKKKKD